MAKIPVVVQKMTGEVLEMQLNPEDPVTLVQDRVASELGVPHLCQKLWINNATPAMVQKTVPAVLMKMEAIVSDLDKRMVSEVKALARPPTIISQMMIMIYYLLNKEKGQADWGGCKKMLANVVHWFEDLHRFSTTVYDLPLKKVKAAKAIADQLDSEGKFTAYAFERVSLLCGRLFDWVVMAFQVHETLHQPGDVSAIEMSGHQCVSVYQDDSNGDSIQVALVADYNEVFLSLEQGRKVIPALDALEVIAGKCTDRSVPALAKYLKHNCEEWRQKALKIVKTAFQQGDLQIAEDLAKALKHFYCDESEEALEALEFLGPSNRAALRCIISGTNCKPRRVQQGQPRRKIKRVKKMVYDNTDDAHAFRVLCLDIFKTVEAEADPIQVIDDVLEAILDGPGFKKSNMEDAVQKEVLEALALVAVRNYDHALSVVLSKLAPPPGVQQMMDVNARAAQAAKVFAKKEDEKLLEVFTTIAQESEMEWDMATLIVIAESFLELSDARSPFVETVIQRLGEDPSQEARAIHLLAKIAPRDDAPVIHRMSRYLRNAHEIIHYDGPTVVKAAADCLDKIVSDKSVSEKAYTALITILIHRCCGPIASSSMNYQWVGSGRKPSPTHRFLLEVAEKQGGVKDIDLWKIASGFTSSIAEIRLESIRIFKTIAKSPEAKPMFVLFTVLNENFSSYSCCAAIDVLTGYDEPEVTQRLLGLLSRPECSVKTAALEALMKHSPESSVKDPVLKCLDDQDHFVRRAALHLLLDREVLREGELSREDVDGLLLRCLGDASAEVALVAMEALSKLQPRQPERLSEALLSKALEFMVHADPKLRLEASRLAADHLSFSAAAREALQTQHLWPETSTPVREISHAVLAA